MTAWIRIDPRIKDVLRLVSFLQGRGLFELASEILLQPIEVTDEEIAKWHASRFFILVDDEAGDLIREQAKARGLSMRKLGNAKLAKGLGRIMIGQKLLNEWIDSARASLDVWQEIGKGG